MVKMIENNDRKHMLVMSACLSLDDTDTDALGCVTLTDGTGTADTFGIFFNDGYDGPEPVKEIVLVPAEEGCAAGGYRVKEN